MQDLGILSILPPIIAIVMAFITKQTIISLFAGVFIGALMLSGWNPIIGFIATIRDFIFPTMGSEWNQTIILMMVFIGGLSMLLERGGGANAFGDVLTKKVTTRKQGRILSWVGGLAVFFSDSTNPVLVGPIFRPITDHLKISREKLAYTVDSTSATVPALLPFTAWGAYVVGLVSNIYADIGYEGNSMTAFVQGIPYQYYTIGAILAVLVFAVTNIDFGPMKKAEDRAYYEGKLASDTSTVEEMEIMKMPEGANPTIWNMVVPLVVLIITLFSMFMYTGNVAENGVLVALSNADSTLSLDVGFLVAGIVALLFTVYSGVFTLGEAWGTWLKGVAQMVEAILVLILAWSLGNVTGAVGTADFVVRVTENFLTPTTFLLAIFIAASFTSFTTGSSWGPFAIFLPISIPLALAVGVPMGAAVGVVMSGGIFGDHCSPISDTTILSSMGASCDHMDHVRTQLPYALMVALSSGIGYLVAGLTGGPWVGLIVSVGLMIAFIFLGGKIDSSRNPSPYGNQKV